jgi:hydrogenase expression/formation protein HypC
LVYLLAYITITNLARSPLGTADPYDLAQVGKITEIHGETGTVDLGGGTIVDANIGFTDVKAGDYVLVHAGYVLRVLDLEEARRMLDRWR